jgi:hypothetical protein
VAIHDLCFDVEEIVENYELLSHEELHWYISVNPYQRKNGRIIKTGTINKIVLDFDSDNPDETIQEARYMFNFLKNKGYYPLVFTSGRKGLHIHFLINELENVDYGIKRYFESFNLKTLDQKVISDQSARITRIPGTKHPKGEGVRLVDINSGDTIHDLKEISLSDVVFMKPTVNTLEKFFVELNKKPPRKPQKKVYLSKYMSKKPIQNWNVVDRIFSEFYETGKHVHGSKHIVSCPFHGIDKNPSAFYTDKLFHCSTCNVSVGSFNLLTRLMGKSKKEAIQIIKEYQ